jgi:hypothetical protein
MVTEREPHVTDALRMLDQIHAELLRAGLPPKRIMSRRVRRTRHAVVATYLFSNDAMSSFFQRIAIKNSRAKYENEFDSTRVWVWHGPSASAADSMYAVAKEMRRIKSPHYTWQPGATFENGYLQQNFESAVTWASSAGSNLRTHADFISRVMKRAPAWLGRGVRVTPACRYDLSFTIRAVEIPGDVDWRPNHTIPEDFYAL